MTLSLPPGPRGTLRTTLRVLREPFHWLPTWRERYGDPFMLPAMNGNVFMTGDPEGVKTIFGAPHSTFGVFGAEAAKPVVGEGSVMVMEGPSHKQERKRLDLVLRSKAPPVHGGDRRGYGPPLERTARWASQRA